MCLVKKFFFTNLDTFRNERIEEIENAKKNDFKDTVCRSELTNDQILFVLFIFHVGESTTGYTLSPGTFYTSDFNFMIETLLPSEMKVFFTIDDIRMRSILSTNKAIKFTDKPVFFTMPGLTHSQSGYLVDSPELLTQKVPVSSKSEKPINITGIDQAHT